MKHILTATFLAILLSGLTLRVAAAADAPLPTWHVVTNGADAVQAGPTLQITPSSREPVTCAPANRGVIALTQEMRLCVCDGKRWHLEVAPAMPCAWGDQ